jgi:hypothetical protein
VVSTIDDAGWSLRPTHIWFQTRPTPFRLTRAILPAWVRLQPFRRFWGIVYPASYVLAVGYLLKRSFWGLFGAIWLVARAAGS